MKSNKILIIFAVLLLFSNYLTYSAIDRLENRVSNLNNSVSRLADRMNNISGQVSRSLNEFNAENSWTRNSWARGTSYKEETKTVAVDVEVEFNELGNGERVYIVARDTEGNVKAKVDVTEDLKNSLKLDCTLDLGIDSDYDLTILGETADSRRSDEIDAVYIKSMIQQVCYVDGHSWGSEYDEDNNYKSTEIDIMIDSPYQKEEFIADYYMDRKIIDIRGEVYVDDVLYDTIDFLKDENWTTYGRDNQGNEEVREIPVVEEGTMPLLELGGRSDYFINFDGNYIFDKPVKQSQNVQLFVILKDNKGDEYRNLVYGVFEW